MRKIDSMKTFIRKKNIVFNLFLLIAFLFLQNIGQAQLLSSKENKNLSRDHIQLLHEGTLIVPLFRQSHKIETLESMINEGGVDESTKLKLQKILDEEIDWQNEFNKTLVLKFDSLYSFSKVFFIYDDELKNFDPGEAIFLDPQSLEKDSSLTLNDKEHYFLKYRKASGVATSPIDVRFFVIADSSFQVLERPFPGSPGRRSSFSLRFKDLLNISPNTNDLLDLLVTKLNSNLERYYFR